MPLTCASLSVSNVMNSAILQSLGRRAVRSAAWAWLLAVLAGVAMAEDIDLYAAAPANAGRPNVLFVLDNAANFSANAANCTYSDGTAPSLDGTAGGIEQCALYNVVAGLPLGADGSGVVNIGLMAYNANNEARRLHVARALLLVMSSPDYLIQR